MTVRLSAASRTAAALVGVVVTMGALSFAAVPFYDWFCRVTGYAGTTQVAETPTDQVIDQQITVHFAASTAAGMLWKFRAVEPEMTLKLGQNALAFYEAHNPTDRVIAGTASYNVSPDLAGPHFIKIECFCFTEQILQPGETVRMPVSFYVDPAMALDPEAYRIPEITLSYTFHETELTEPQAALASPATSVQNRAQN
jgi:cytochrome c oxidase assembly protein subunit 11